MKLTSGNSVARVLLVDDEELVRVAFGRTVVACGHELVTASSADEALDVLEQRNVDVVLTDFVMPGHDGMWLLATVKARWPHVRRLLMSGTERAGRQQSTAELVHCFLSKPMSLAALHEALGG